jgi:hypothetical protein
MDKTQWHPIFARLLRPRIEKHYEMRLNVSVGELPREADILLLRRTSSGATPFQGLWRHLTAWNVLEFKGPTVSARSGDIEALVELGLGINRKLNEDRATGGEPLLNAADVSFWYLANRLGRTVLRDFRWILGEIEPVGPGVWRSEVMRRTVFLISGRDLPVEEDSLPMHIIGREAEATERAVAQFVAARTSLAEEYGDWLAVLHPEAWKEVKAMATTKRKGPEIDIQALVRIVGLQRVVDAVGLKKVVDTIGLKRVLDELGPERLLNELGPEGIVANLSAAERRKLKELLK